MPDWQARKDCFSPGEKHTCRCQIIRWNGASLDSGDGSVRDGAPQRRNPVEAKRSERLAR